MKIGLLLFIDMGFANPADPEAYAFIPTHMECRDFRDTSVFGQLERIRQNRASAQAMIESGWGMFEGRDSQSGFDPTASEDEERCWSRVASGVTTLEDFWAGAFAKCVETDEQAYYLAADHLHQVPGGLDAFLARYPESDQVGQAALMASVRAVNVADIEGTRHWMAIAAEAGADLSPLSAQLARGGDMQLVADVIELIQPGSFMATSVRAQIAIENEDWAAAETLLEALTAGAGSVPEIEATLLGVRFELLGDNPSKDAIRAWISSIDALGEGVFATAKALEVAAARLPKKESAAVLRRIVETHPESLQAARAARTLAKKADDAEALLALATEVERIAWWPEPLVDPEFVVVQATGMAEADRNLRFEEPWDGEPETLVSTDMLDAWRSARDAPADDACLAVELALGSPVARRRTMVGVLRRTVTRRGGEPETRTVVFTEKVIAIDAAELPGLRMMVEPQIRVATVGLPAQIEGESVSVEIAGGITLRISRADVEKSEITAADLTDQAVVRGIHRALLQGRVSVHDADGQPFARVVVTEQGPTAMVTARRRYLLTDPDVVLFTARKP